MVKRNPHSIVEVGGTRYDSWRDKQMFKQVTVELTSNMASEAVFRFFDPRFRILDSYTTSDGVPMLPMRFWMGFGEDLGEPLFKGLLARVERGDSDTTFRAYDNSHKMKQEKLTDYHYSKDDIEIIERLARRNGLNFVGPDSPVKLDKHATMIQDFRNDWEHAIERARECGLVLYVRGDTLFAKEAAKIGAPLITLKFRKDFIVLHNFDLSFKLPENHQGRNKQVEWRARRRGGRRLTGKSSHHPRGTYRSEGTKSDPAIHTPNYVSRKAHASKDLQREHAYVCTIRSIPPLPNVRPDIRDTVEIQNFGKLFSGSYLLDKVTHDHTAEGFSTEYSLYRDRS